jgi:geranylgeranyl pyrophosphate synthase
MLLDWMPKETAEAVTKLDLNLTVHTVPEIDILLTKTVLFRGKKFRPTLCFLMGQLLGIRTDVLHPYARAAEFVHAATLAHDDVIDESSTRRNRPTLNARSSNGRAVLAGDLLLARVMAELSALGKIEIIHDLAKTVEDLVSGEWLQLEARGIASINRQHLETVAKKKTASLMAWCCAAPVRLSGVSLDLIEPARGFGEALGVAFQMIDDIIDYDASGEKPFAQDVREGLVNYVTLEMLEHNSDLLQPLQRILGKVPENLSSSQGVWPWQSQELNAACDRVRARAQAKLEVADQYLSQISQALESPDFEALQALRSILVYLRERIR